MQQLSTKQIRAKWLEFFKKNDHLIILSKSLIPINDSSLLWINSGVATLKDYFAGIKTPPYPRLANSQKAIRTNDIENVGITARHHTFFEMLGNFAIGDYFKDKAIKLAYDFIFKELKFNKKFIYITYYEKDEETYNLWIKIGINKSHLISGNKEMNFWDVGQGPCGPDTEIFYDRGVKYDSKNIGIKLLKEDIENDRFVEIWNIVFSQFNNDGNNNYLELKQKNIDTGAGLERIASIIQDVPTNFDTDAFIPIINQVEKFTNKKYMTNNYFIKNKKQIEINKNFKIIADHMRAIVMTIQDGATPSNTSRGYIIRRLIRRSYRAGLQLAINQKTFLYTLVKSVANILDIYPVNINDVAKIIKNEELLFENIINKGKKLLYESIKNQKQLDFNVAFKLFETFGLPIELTQEILKEQGIKLLNVSKFNEYKQKHAQISRDKTISGMKSQINVIQEITSKVSKFSGYDKLQEMSKVIFCKKENNKYYVLTESTPFYAKGGGQDCDKGKINNYEVLEVFKDKYGNNWHTLSYEVTGVVHLWVNDLIRIGMERNHSATHLLGEALRQIIHPSIIQLGSNNNEKKLRFDFPLRQKPSNQQIIDIEKLVNSYIQNKHKRVYIETNVQNAKKLGALSLDGEDYGDEVRVVDFNNISKELCGGTHVANTEVIEKFKIIKLETKGSGIYRIEAITSNKKIQKFEAQQKKQLLKELKIIINKNKKNNSNYKLSYNYSINNLLKAIDQAKKDNKTFNKKNKQISIDFDKIKFQKVDNKLIYTNMNTKPSEVKSFAIQLRDKFPNALIIIGAKTNDNFLVAIASIKYDCQKEKANRFPKMNGGGSYNFIMGTI